MHRQILKPRTSFGFVMIGSTLGHYRIQEKIGAGGMGEVYRALDENLDRDVALKLLPAGTLSNENARKQFRKEALALARLNHHNIETIYEFDSDRGVDFLVMELILGTPLSEAVRNGPMAEQEIVRLGAQFADGLAAAHHRGVIHRDLKPGNLMVTRDGNLKILDFGLAKLRNPDQDPDLTRSVTDNSGPISGTLPYMSPEQLRGLPVDARSDIYAAGAVLYEMATASRPFPQSQTAELMGAILYHTPPSPRSLNPKVSGGLDGLICKALHKEPSQRFQTARELGAALEGIAHFATRKLAGARIESGEAVREIPSVAADSSRAKLSPSARWAIVAVAAILVAVGVAIGFNLDGLRSKLLRGGNAREAVSQPSSAPIHPRRSVAVLGFKNVSGRQDEAWLSTALSETVDSELAAGGQLRTIPGESVVRMRTDLALPEADSYAPDTLQKIRKNLGADLVIEGSYIALQSAANSQIRVDVQMQDTQSGEIVAAVVETGKESELNNLFSQAGADLRAKLGVRPVTEVEAQAARASLPGNPQAARYYAEGLAKLRTYESLSARDLLTKAVAAEPDFALAHSALAAAWASLGYDAKAEAQARKAFELSAPLDPADRQWVEGRYREISHDYNGAVKIYQSLLQEYPDDLDYGLRLAVAQQNAGRGQDALATLAALRKLSPAASEDPRIDLAEASACETLADYHRMAEAAARADQIGEASGARLVVARARSSQGSAFRALGQYDQATAALEDSIRLFGAAGDPGSMPLLSLGSLQAEQGDLSRAQKTFADALQVNQQIGNRRGEAIALTDLGHVQLDRGELETARTYYVRAIAIQREIEDTRNAGSSLSNLGRLLFQLGNYSEATKTLTESLAIARQVGNRRSEAYVLNFLGEPAFAQGNLAQSKQLNEQSLQIAQQIGHKRVVEAAMAGIAEVLLAQGDFDGAEKQEQAALSVAKEIQEKGSEAQYNLALARIALERGLPTDAQTFAQGPADEFRNEKAQSEEALAQCVLAQALLAQGKLADAQKSRDLATAAAAHTQDHGVSFQVALTDAQVRGATNAKSAVAQLQTLVTSARAQGCVPCEFQARLSLSQIQAKSKNSGEASTGRNSLAALEKDATAKGFLLIASKARESGSAALAATK